jgi:hypothetical protein
VLAFPPPRPYQFGMKRMSWYFLPAMAVAAAVFGAFYLWAGVRNLLAANWGMGALISAFGICGIALGMALWQFWKKFAKG